MNVPLGKQVGGLLGNIVQDQVRKIEKERKVLNYDDPGFEMRNMRYTDQELDSDAFTKLLGLPKITLEQLWEMSKESDEMVIDIMSEQSHFVATLEGYPDLMSYKQSVGKVGDSKIEGSKNLATEGSTRRDATPAGIGAKESTLSQPSVAENQDPTRHELMSLLDFYSDSMSFITKLVGALTNNMDELTDALKPHDNVMRSVLETQMLKAALSCYRQTQAYLTGEETEAQGHEYLESEMVVGSSDKMLFHIKEMLSELSGPKKTAMNPFIVAKLNVPSIKLFPFPVGIKREQNPYLLRTQDMDLVEGKTVNISLAQSRFGDKEDFQRNVVNGFKHEAMEDRNSSLLPQVQRPSLLQLECNALEVMRVRQELMMCVSECSMLEELFLRQAKRCNMASLKASYAEGLSFPSRLAEPSEINYVDDGPASHLTVDLAIRELDPTLLSNLNFRSPDAFKIMVTNSGLEELRLILHYQTMHKQALIVATRSNQAAIDPHLRA